MSIIDVGMDSANIYDLRNAIRTIIASSQPDIQELQLSTMRHHWYKIF